MILKKARDGARLTGREVGSAFNPTSCAGADLIENRIYGCNRSLQLGALFRISNLKDAGLERHVVSFTRHNLQRPNQRLAS